MKFDETARIAVRETKVSLKYRKGIEELEANINNKAYFTGILGVLFDKGWYAWSLEKLRALYACGDRIKACVQVVAIGPAVFVGIPAEYFSDFVLEIKQHSLRRYTWVMSTTNGWLGYVPTKQAFMRRGGHESTLAWWSKMSPDTGDLLAQSAIKLIRKVEGKR